MFTLYFNLIFSIDYILSGSRENLTILGNGTAGGAALDNLGIKNVLKFCLIGEGITALSSSCFENYGSLRVCYLPKSLKNIGAKAFLRCINLETIYIPEGVSAITSQTFMYTVKLKFFSIPSSLSDLDLIYTFYKNEEMQQFIVSEQNQFFSTDEKGLYLMSKDKTILYSSYTNKTIVIPDSIKKINSFFGYGRTLIKDIVFSSKSNLKRIESEAFRYAYGITSLVLPEGLVYLGDNFAMGSGIVSLTLPSTLEEISTNAFGELWDLETIYLSPMNQNFSYVSAALYNKDQTNLYFILPNTDSITIPSTVTNVPSTILQQSKRLSKVKSESETFLDFENILYLENGKELFACPGNLSHAKIHPSCEKICNGAFSTTSIKSVEFLSHSLLSIQDTAFTSSSIEEIELPEGLTTIYGYAFSYCKSLTRITFPSTLSNILGLNAMEYCNIKEANFSMCVNLTSLCEGMFSFCPKLENVSLPPNIEFINSKCFYSCTSLLSITFPSSTQYVEESAFWYCKSLSAVSFDLITNLSSIMTTAFGQTNLSVFHLPDSCTTIGERAFQDCAFLTEFDIGEQSKLESLKPQAFTGTGITELKFGSFLSSIEVTAFTGANNLTSIKFAETNQHFIGKDGIVYSIDEKDVVACACGVKSAVISNKSIKFIQSAFYKCKKLVTLEFSTPSVMESIQINTFVECTSLETIKLPASLQIIEKLAFQKCSSLKEVFLEGGSVLESIGESAFQECNSLSVFSFDKMELSLPMKSIDANAFNGCPLTSIDLSNVESIGSMAFQGSKLAKVVLSQKAKSIGDSAFANSLDLVSAKIFFVESQTSLGTNIFSGCTSLSHLDFCSAVSPKGDFLGKTSLKKVFVPFSFNGQTVSGITVERVYDDDCLIPTVAFSAPLKANKVSAELCAPLLGQSIEGI